MNNYYLIGAYSCLGSVDSWRADSDRYQGNSNHVDVEQAGTDVGSRCLDGSCLYDPHRDNGENKLNLS